MKVLNLYADKKIYFDRKGYAIVWMGGKNKKVHVLEWEKHNGPKPDGYQVHHKDHNKANWNIDNLVLMTPKDHQKTHASWVKDENGEWALKPCIDCKELLALDKFYQRKGMTPSNRCISCSTIYFKSIQTPEFKARRKVYMNKYYQANKEKWA